MVHLDCVLVFHLEGFYGSSFRRFCIHREEVCREERLTTFLGRDIWCGPAYRIVIDWDPHS